MTTIMNRNEETPHRWGPLSRLWAGLEWRWRWRFRPRIERFFGVREIQWVRVRVNEETDRFIRALDCSSLSALEISGQQWSQHGFRSYRSVEYPEYDICAGPLERSAFDVIFLEQVLEHVLWPYRAVRNVWEMLK